MPYGLKQSIVGSPRSFLGMQLYTRAGGSVVIMVLLQVCCNVSQHTQALSLYLPQRFWMKKVLKTRHHSDLLLGLVQVHYIGSSINSGLVHRLSNL